MNLDRIQRATQNRVLALQRKYIGDLEEIVDSGQSVTPKTMKTKLLRARERLKDFQREVENLVGEKAKEVFFGTLKDVADELRMGVNLDAVSGKALAVLRDHAFTACENYAEDILKNVRTQLYLSLINGESYSDAYGRIKPLGNARARPQVMIRDQLSLIHQKAILEGYGSSGHPQDFEYWWTGPDDERTTEVCDERKAGNPYTWEQVKDMEIHPHIQCRHRWRALPKTYSEKQENTSADDGGTASVMAKGKDLDEIRMPMEEIELETRRADELLELHREYREEIDKLEREYSLRRITREEFNQMSHELSNRINKGMSDVLKKYDPKRMEDAQRKLQEEILEKISKRRKLNTQDLVFVKGSNIDQKNLLNRVSRFLPEDWIKASNAGKPFKVVKADGRAYYAQHRNEMRLGNSPSTALHELAHRIEAEIPDLHEKLLEFYDKRTEKDTLQRLKDITVLDYADYEVTKADRWSDPYIGRYYEYGGDRFATEILSMGLEGLFFGKHGIWSKDPELLKFIYGLVVSL